MIEILTQFYMNEYLFYLFMIIIATKPWLPYDRSTQSQLSLRSLRLYGNRMLSDRCDRKVHRLTILAIAAII